MANSKGRCTHCKKYSAMDKLVKVPAGKFCNKTCLMEYATKPSNKSKLITIGRKEAKKQTGADLLELNKKSLSWQHKQTQPVFNRMRVLEELEWFYSRNLEPTCISCGMPKGNDVWSCGHFKTRGGHSQLAYDPINTYLQHNKRCNQQLSADIYGTKTTHGYIQGLKNRFGDVAANEIIEHCETTTESVKWTCDQLEQMRTQFNKRIRELKPIVERLAA